MARRKNFTVQYKLNVINWIKINKSSLNAASKQFNIDRKCIRDWLAKEDQLKKVRLTRSSKSRSVKKLQPRRPMYPDIDELVLQYMKDQRSQGHAVTEKIVCRYAKRKFYMLHSDHEGVGFKASHGWFRNFRERNKIAYRRVTSVGQHVPNDAAEIAEEFLNTMRDLNCDGERRGYWNMDETPVYFDLPRGGSYDFEGASNVRVTTTGNEKLRFTVALTCGVFKSEGVWVARKLPPLVIFKNLTKAPRGNFPKDMTAIGTKGGSMATDIMVEIYLKHVWQKRPRDFFRKRKDVFIMDKATCHQDVSITEGFAKQNTIVEYIHPGCTKFMQFLDTHINKPFKEAVRVQWEEWMTRANPALTKSGKLQRAPYDTVCHWVQHAWDEVATQNLIVKGFKESGYIDFSGDVTQLHSSLAEVLQTRAVPQSVIDEVEAHLQELNDEAMEDLPRNRELDFMDDAVTISSSEDSDDDNPFGDRMQELIRRQRQRVTARKFAAGNSHEVLEQGPSTSGLGSQKPSPQQDDDQDEYSFSVKLRPRTINLNRRTESEETAEESSAELLDEEDELYQLERSDSDDSDVEVVG